MLRSDPAGLVAAMEELCKSFENPETVGEHEFTIKYGETLRVARGKLSQARLEERVAEDRSPRSWT